jgi:hypothetical protein
MRSQLAIPRKRLASGLALMTVLFAPIRPGGSYHFAGQ